MLVNTSAIDAFASAQHQHADDLAAVGANLAAAQVSADAFGPVGARFLAMLNAALAEQGREAARLADRFATASSTAATTADAYRDSEAVAEQALSMHAE